MHARSQQQVMLNDQQTQLVAILEKPLINPNMSKLNLLYIKLWVTQSLAIAPHHLKLNSTSV